MLQLHSSDPGSADIDRRKAGAAQAVSDLRRAQPERKVSFEIEPDPIASGDSRLLSVVLVNVIGNAWKFTARTPEAHRRARHPNERCAFVVQDNGVGFDTFRAAHLFAPFQRFHQATDFSGTGVGLATVQRVVTRHGGRIWVESAPNRGAAFFFSLSA